jgi:hypothetical protein
MKCHKKVYDPDSFCIQARYFKQEILGKFKPGKPLAKLGILPEKASTSSNAQSA